MTFSNRMWGAAAMGVALLGGGLGAPVQAGYVVTVAQVGSNVVATGTGSIDLTGLTFTGLSGSSVPLVISVLGVIATGAPGATPGDYTGFTGPRSFGIGGPTTADIGTGDYVGIAGIAGVIALPNGYVSGSPLSDTAIYGGATLASLALTPGTYVWTLPADTFTLKIVGSVPEPASLAVLTLPLGLVMLLGTRRR